MHFLILQALLFGITYARNCTISTEKCPEGEIKWKQRAEEFNCTNKYGRYTCMKDSKNRLVETCVDNIVIKGGVVGCPYVVICKDIHTAFIGLDEDFKECPTNNSGCPPQQHSGYSLHEIYKYPACSGNSDSLMSGNEDTSTKLSEQIKWTYVVLPIVIILVVLFVVLGILLYLRRKNRLGQCCLHATKSNDVELGTSNRLIEDEDAKTGKDEDTELCDDKTRSEIEKKLSEFGNDMEKDIMEGNSDKIMERLDGWKNEPVRIGIAGPSMVGKSSFINVMLGKSKCDRAKVGIGNTTQERTFYYHPNNKGLQFWDLPGYGTPEFELSNEYLKRMRIEEYDFVLIMYSTVISSTDIEFARKLMKANKMFAFVRTKADEFLDMKEKSFEQWCREAKTKCQNTLKDKGVSFENEKEQIFVISNKKPEKGDFDNLMNFLTENTVELKRMNILITLRRQTLPMIDEKEKQLLSRAWKAAIAIGVSTALPVPGVDIAFNIALLKKEIKFYLEIFQLDEESLKEYPNFAVKKLKFCQEIISDGIHKFIVHNIAGIAIVAVFSNIFEIAIPFIGGILNGSISAARMYSFLHKVISKLAEEARELKKEQANHKVKRNC